MEMWRLPVKIGLNGQLEDNDMWTVTTSEGELQNIIDVNCRMQGRGASVEIEFSANLTEEFEFLNAFLNQESSEASQLVSVDIEENGVLKFSGDCFIESHRVYFTENNQNETVVLRPKGQFTIGQNATFQNVNN